MVLGSNGESYEAAPCPLGKTTSAGLRGRRRKCSQQFGHWHVGPRFKCQWYLTTFNRPNLSIFKLNFEICRYENCRGAKELQVLFWSLGQILKVFGLVELWRIDMKFQLKKKRFRLLQYTWKLTSLSAIISQNLNCTRILANSKVEDYTRVYIFP